MSENLGSKESWQVALKISDRIGTIPGVFGSAVRTLVLDQSKGGTLSAGGRHGLRTFLKGPSMRAAIFYLAKTCREERIQDDTFERSSKLCKLFNPGELATIIAVLFAYKKILKICQKYENPWAERYAAMSRDIDLGGVIGDAIPNIGFSWGIFIPAINHISHALMLDADQKAAREYKLHLKNESVVSDIEFENEAWGCTHGQICSSLSQKLLVGTEMSEAMIQGFQIPYRDQQLKDPNELKVQVCKIWIDEFVTSQGIPDMPHRGEYYPKAEALDRLLKLAPPIASGGSPNHWLNKTATDISPETHPLLFIKGDFAKAGEVPVADVMASNEITEEELQELEQELETPSTGLREAEEAAAKEEASKEEAEPTPEE